MGCAVWWWYFLAHSDSKFGNFIENVENLSWCMLLNYFGHCPRSFEGTRKIVLKFIVFLHLKKEAKIWFTSFSLLSTSVYFILTTLAATGRGGGDGAAMTQFRLLEVLTKFPIYCSQIFFDLSKKKPLWIWHKSSVHAVVFIEISCKIQAFGYAYLVHNTVLFHDQGSYYNITALYCNSFLFPLLFSNTLAP